MNRLARRLATALVAVLVLPPLPYATAIHPEPGPQAPTADYFEECYVLADSLNRVPRLSGDKVLLPCTGVAPADFAVTLAITELNKGIRTLNGILTDVNTTLDRLLTDRIPAETNATARLLSDGLGADAEVGRLGPWRHGAISGADLWNETDAAAANGSWSLAAYDRETGRYTHATDAYLVSPPIDLSGTLLALHELRLVEKQKEELLASLADDVGVVDRLAERTGAPQAAGGLTVAESLRLLEAEIDVAIAAVRAANPVLLSFDHRYNLKDGRDGGRLELFTEEPTPDAIAEGQGVRLCPRGAANPAATGLERQRATEARGVKFLADALVSFLTDEERTIGTNVTRTTLSSAPDPIACHGGRTAAALAAIDAGGNGTGYTGTSMNASWERAEFDLSQHTAGSVWLVWRLRTVEPPGGERPVYFSTGFGNSSFYGWWLDNVRLDAAAWPHNVRVVDLATPGPARGPTGPPIPVPEDSEVPILARVQNVGSWNETLVVRLTTTPETAPQPFPRETRLRLAPGEVGAVAATLATGARRDVVLRVEAFLPTDDREAGADARVQPGRSTVAVFELPGTLGDNVLARTLAVRTVHDVRAEVRATPALGDKGVPRTGHVVFENRGNVPERLTARVAVVTQGGLDVSGESEVSPAEPFSVVLPPGARTEHEVGLSPKSAGVLELRVRYSSADVSGEARTPILVRKVPAPLFYDTHNRALQPTPVGSGTTNLGNWTQTIPARPVDGAMWRLDRSVGILAAKIPAAGPFDALFVNFTHMIRQADAFPDDEVQYLDV
ncbi:MAG: hypothetical protein ACT4PT_02195, partial [Methanobacteriota archaeon]